jgi:genome maintenance exonuclease 1
MFNHCFVTPPVMSVHTAEDGVRHYLTPEGARYESVTTYIGRHWDKSFLVKWKKRIGEAKAASQSRHATDRGSYVHKMTEKYLMNDELGYRKMLNEDLFNKALFLKIKPELEKLNNIRMMEKAIYSDELKLAGTPDIMADYDRIFSTVDLKTSTREKQEEWITTYWIQTAIYSRMYQERFGEMPQQSVIIMAVEETPMPAVFIEPSYKGQQRLQEFMDDPLAFQERLNAEKEAKKKAEKKK